MSNKRSARLSEAYIKELSEIMYYRIRDPRLSGVHITNVLFTPDLKLAKVYFNMSGGRVREKEVISGFEKSKGYIKKEISSRINIKHTPDLRFYYDDHEEVKERIDNLFKQIEQRSSRSDTDAGQNDDSGQEH